MSGLFSIGVTRVRDYLKTIYPKGSLCSLSHWLEASDIRCIKYDSVCRQSAYL